MCFLSDYSVIAEDGDRSAPSKGLRLDWADSEKGNVVTITLLCIGIFYCYYGHIHVKPALFVQRHVWSRSAGIH